MVTRKSFGIIGGDFRQIYLAKKFNHDHNEVFLYGFDKLKNFSQTSSHKGIHEIINKSDYLIMPLPATRDGINIYSPLSENIIPINDKFLNLLHNKTVFGDLTKFIKTQDDLTIYDYSKKEEFQIMNAIPTVEGAIKIALNMQNQTLFKSNCLIAGFGRIGKILANRLEKFNANITITTRNNIDLVWADTLGYTPIDLSNISNTLSSYNFIFNTIPQTVFNKQLLLQCNKNVSIIDLASPPGGFDKTATEELNINYRHELGIPGKMFPKTAANIIYYSIQKIIEEKIL